MEIQVIFTKLLEVELIGAEFKWCMDSQNTRYEDANVSNVFVKHYVEFLGKADRESQCMMLTGYF